MKNEPVSLRILEKKKATTRFGVGLLLIVSISVILFFAIMLDNRNAALYYQACFWQVRNVANGN